MALSHNPRIVTDGLVLCLDAANPKSYPGSGTTWFDLSRNGYSMDLINSPTINSKGISFDGVNQYAQGTGLPTFSLGTNYSIEIVFRMISLPTEQYSNNMHVLLGQVGNSHTIFVYPQENGASSVGMCYDDSRYSTRHKSTKRILPGEWIHFFINGYASSLGDIEYFVNGELDTARFTSADSNGSGFSSTYRLGYDSRWGAYSNLEVGLIKVYDRNLIESEIQQNFNALRGRYGI